jgi:hypothetical protein
MSRARWTPLKNHSGRGDYPACKADKESAGTKKVNRTTEV